MIQNKKSRFDWDVNLTKVAENAAKSQLQLSYTPSNSAAPFTENIKMENMKSGDHFYILEHVESLVVGNFERMWIL